MGQKSVCFHSNPYHGKLRNRHTCPPCPFHAFPLESVKSTQMQKLQYQHEEITYLKPFAPFLSVCFILDFCPLQPLFSLFLSVPFLFLFLLFFAINRPSTLCPLWYNTHSDNNVNNVINKRNKINKMSLQRVYSAPLFVFV